MVVDSRGPTTALSRPLPTPVHNAVALPSPAPALRFMSTSRETSGRLFGMSGHYERWLIARGNYFSPSAAGLVKLIEKLRTEKWIVAPQPAEVAKLRFEGGPAQHARATGGYAVTTVANTFGNDANAKLTAGAAPQPAAISTDWLEAEDREELRLVWPVAGDEPLPVKYPLSRKPDGDAAYALEIHRAFEYVYPTSKTIGLIPTLCHCTEDLSFEWDDEELVPAFGTATGIATECEACSRTFDPSKGVAIITDPLEQTREEVRGGAAYRFALKVGCSKAFAAGPPVTFAPELVTLIETEFGRSFYEVANFEG